MPSVPVGAGIVSGIKKKKENGGIMKQHFTPGDLVIRKNIPDSEYGIVIEEIPLDTWINSDDPMEIAEYKNMQDKAVKVIWFWCTDSFSTYVKGKGGGRLHNAWELASRIVKAKDDD